MSIETRLSVIKDYLTADCIWPDCCGVIARIPGRRFSGTPEGWTKQFDRTRLVGTRLLRFARNDSREWRFALTNRNPLLAPRVLANSAPDALGGGRHWHVGNAERAERVEDRIHDRRCRGDGAAFADSFEQG